MELTQEYLNELYLKVRRQAVTDEEYRKELLADPNGTLEKELGEALPDGFKIQVIESDPAYAATFVLPDLAGEELEDEELNQVAGGFSIAVIISACAAAISVEGCAADACGARGAVKK